MLKARVFITLKEGVLDPQGKAVKGALASLGYQQVEDVRIGKLVLLSLKASNRQEAENEVREMCDHLLANLVIEDYSFELQEA